MKLSAIFASVWQWLTKTVLWVGALFIMLASSAALAAITFDPTPSTGGSGLTQMEIIQDAGNPTLSGEYLGVRFSSSTPLTNVYARAIVGGVGYSLDATEAQDHFIGDLSATAKTSYWFINYPTSGNGTFQVQIYVGNPATGGVLQGTSTVYTVSSANADNSAAANKLVSVNVVPSSIQIGQNFNVVVCYSVNSTARLLVEPAISSAFDPNNLRLGNVVVDLYGSADCTGAATATLANQLLFAGPVNATSVRATYTFQTIGTTSVALTPIVSARSGIYKYNSDFSTFPATIPAPTNNVTLAKSVNITSNSVGNITVTYTITATNPGSAAVVLDQIIDTLPSSPGAATYTANSTTVNGTAQAAFNPVISGQTLTWGSTGSAGTTFTVPAAGTLTLGFNAVIPVTNGVYTNSAIAKINTTQIDTTASLGDNAPATAITRIGPPVLTVTKTADTPTVVNTATGTTARYTIKVANTGTTATGVKLNDALLPTGFTYLSTVAVNTPTSGTCTTAATRTTTVNPTVGATSPSWGDFSIPGGCDVSIQFDAAVASTVANGTYSNSATTTTNTAGATITNFDGTPVATTVDNVVVGSAILAVTKTTSTPTIVNTATGTTATYTLTVTNSGTANATGVKVIDTLAAGFTYGSTTSITLNGTAVLAANFQTITTGTQTTATPQWDTNPTAGFTINAGQTLVITFVANVASTVTDGTYNNSASASATNTSNITNFDGTPVATTVDNVAVTSAVLAVTKTTSTPTIVNTATGTAATYTLTVTNSGTANATGVKVIDTLAAGFTYGSTSSITLNGTAVLAANFQTITTGTQTTATPQWDTNPTGGFTINTGQTLVITFVASVASTVADGTYNNSASSTSTNAASITNFDGTPVATTVDNVTVTSAVLTVTKTTSTPTIVNTASGTTATYTLTVTNSGTAIATGVKVIDTLAAGFTYGSTTSITQNGTAVSAANFQTITTGTQTTATPQWDTNPAGGFTINASQTLVITFVANVASTVANGTYNNSASATGAARSIANFAGAANTSDDVTVTTGSTPILAVTKTTSTPSVSNTATGTTATYTLTVTNSGTANAAGVKVIDTLAAGFTYASTTSITLNGAAVLAANFQTITTGTQTTATPQWDTNPTGGFTINAGQTLVITFVADVASAVASGTYNNSASASSTNTTSITNFNGAANTSDDVTVTSGVPVSGFVYSDANHNIQKDSAEAGTGLTLFAKLIPTAGGNALLAVTVDLATGAYQFPAVVAGNYSIIIDNNNTLTDTTPTIPAGWVGTEMPTFTRSNVAVSTTELQNLNFGLFNGSKVSGTVFADTGIVSGIANNGIKDGGELGIAGVTLKASTGATIYDTTITDGAGNYTLWIPATATNPVLITETNLSNYLSTGASVGNTVGTYARSTDSTSFTITTGTIYSNVNFGDVPVNTFAANGLQSGLPSNVLFYPHQFNAGSGGSVTFTSVSASGWPTVLYRDLNCNGVIDVADTVLGSSIATAGEQICIINKVTIPTGTALGLQDSATVQAVFTYTNASPALTSTLSVIDTTTVGTSGLVLTKTVDKATALAADTVTYTLTYINNSNEPLANIVINDATPAYTTFLSATCVLPLPAAITACVALPVPAVAGVGTIKWTLTGTLSPSATGQVRYSVKVDN